jgi:hypothetical protein
LKDGDRQGEIPSGGNLELCREMDCGRTHGNRNGPSIYRELRILEEAPEWRPGEGQ